MERVGFAKRNSSFRTRKVIQSCGKAGNIVGEWIVNSVHILAKIDPAIANMGKHLLQSDYLLFGFVPSVVVIITIVMGKQLAQNAPTHEWGLFVMWSGILLVAFTDYWAMTRLLRR